MLKNFIRRLFWILCLMLSGLTPSQATIEQQRAGFLQAELALKNSKLSDADVLIDKLQGYPLQPYLIYKRAALDLGNTALVIHFLTHYAHTRQAELLRSQWLDQLASRGAWSDYLHHYRETENEAQLCNRYLAFYHVGRRNEALTGAEKMWASGSSLPESCDKLFSIWQTSSGLTIEQIWKRFSLAMRKGNQPLISYLQRLLPSDEQALAAFWLKVQDNPELVLSCSEWKASSHASGMAFAYGIDKLASNEPLLAQTAWALHKSRFLIDADEQIRLDKRTALALAAQRYDQAGAYLQAIPQENTDAQIRGWKVRHALLKQDWPNVLQAIDQLEPDEKKSAQWLYWQGRALEALGDKEAALEAFQQAAKERDFYGFNAADRIEKNYPLSPRPAVISQHEIDRLANTQAFLAIKEFKALDRNAEAKAEWMYVIKTLSPQQQAVAATLAQTWGWDQIANITAARAGYWDDLSLRFPLGFYQPVIKNAQKHQLDPAMVFSLIRRESAFDPLAGSKVGARGLMQLMPATGEQLAKRFNEKLPEDGLLEPERNVRYGTAYFRELMERFGNHLALATAAYNAGPNRVERWLPQARPLSADIWVETIPYTETRQYVSAVMSYAVIYQNRMGRNSEKITGFLSEIKPGKKAEIKPDRSLPVNACENS